MRSSIHRGVWRGLRSGRRDRYRRPATPSSRYRRDHSRRARGEIPKNRQRSAVRALPSRYCRTARSLNCTSASTMDWPRRGGRMCWHLLRQHVLAPYNYRVNEKIKLRNVGDGTAIISVEPDVKGDFKALTPEGL